jgi:uncharacterized pyridoxal phosphate-containing UPF0001 family protein
VSLGREEHAGTRFASVTLEGARVAKRSPLAEKLDEVKDRIARACEKKKRDPAEVTLVAVTKTAAPEQIREILSLGVADLGESRVQQLTQRAAQLNEFVARRQVHGGSGSGGEAALPAKIRWHMIGHLQRNKAKPLLPFVHLIHSVDPAKARSSFSRTREIFEELKWNKIGGASLRHLSMGMSDDFEMAIEEGATLVRLGSVLFGGAAQDHEGLEEA